MAQSALADTITVIPISPTSLDPILIRVDGINPNSGTFVFFSNQSIAGNTIRLEACINANGFSVPSTYSVNYSIASLAPGSYSIEYYRAFCNNSGQVVQGLELQVASTLSVLPAALSAFSIPTIDQVGIAALTIAIAAAALGAVKRSA